MSRDDPPDDGFFPQCDCCGDNCDDCDCPECPVCQVSGDPKCYANHGMTWTDKQIAAQEQAREALAKEIRAIDAMFASFFCITPDEELEPVNVGILTEEDRAALDAMGDGLIDRLIETHLRPKKELPR